MINRILLLKKLACAAGIVLLMAGSANADCVYDTDFTGDTYSQDTGNIVFDDGTTTAIETWFGSNNGVGIGTAPDDLSFNNTTQNRYRGTGVWLDTTGWLPGLVTVDVDVSNYVSGADTDIFFQAYSATGVDATNTVSLDLHGAAGLAGAPMATGTATIGTLGAQQTITANGTDVPFTFTYNGTDDFVALTFVQENVAGGTAFGSANLDNLKVNTTSAVPEPSSLALLTAGFGMIGLRRRRLK